MNGRVDVHKFIYTYMYVRTDGQKAGLLAAERKGRRDGLIFLDL